jgi:predicted amidohydrolase
VQTRSTADVAANLASALEHAESAAKAGARLVALPETFGILAERGGLLEAKPLEGHPHLAGLIALAQRHGVYVLAGSVPEAGPDAKHFYNTSTMIAPDGKIIAAYRKIHLFDATLAGGQALRESDNVSAGTDIVVTPPLHGFNVGMSICYDLRFPELYRRLVDEGAHLITIPAAFTLHTGKDHWEPLIRARAIESQCYVLAPAQWGEHGGGRASWGKSMIVDPWGTTLAVAPEAEGFVMARISMSFLESVRARVPSLRHRRL